MRKKMRKKIRKKMRKKNEKKMRKKNEMRNASRPISCTQLQLFFNLHVTFFVHTYFIYNTLVLCIWSDENIQ
jgi:hypothetical protein